MFIDFLFFQFLDSFVTNAGDGGKAAVHALRSSVLSYVRDSLDLPHDSEVVIRVYCRARGLNRHYISLQILGKGQSLEPFIHGFNKAHPLCDFVDVGDGKELADNKIRGGTKYATHAFFLSYSS